MLVRAPIHGVLTINNLPEELSVAGLKHIIAERICLAPARRLHLSFWGRDLPDELSLMDCRIRTNSVIDMRQTLVRLDDIPRPTLERVRVLCTALETRIYPVDTATTALELKQKIAAFLTRGEHEWYSKTGVRSEACGTTVLVTGRLKADEKSGTEAFGPGEELVTTAPFAGEGKGKPITVFRVSKGRPALIGDGSIVPLALPVEKQSLSFHGVPIADDACLWNVGVRHDDTIALEFVSPTVPKPLEQVRAPDKPKGAGKKGGGKGKKKK